MTTGSRAEHLPHRILSAEAAVTPGAPTSGEILSEERPKLDATKTFDDAMSKVRGGADRRAQAFDKAFDRTKHLDDVLEKKFEEARKKAKKGDSKPRSPFDLD